MSKVFRFAYYAILWWSRPCLRNPRNITAFLLCYFQEIYNISRNLQCIKLQCIKLQCIKPIYDKYLLGDIAKTMMLIDNDCK